MSRYVIQTALAFDATEPEFLLIEYGARDQNGGGEGRCVGQFHDIGGAMAYAHERRNGTKLDTVSEKRIALVR